MAAEVLDGLGAVGLFALPGFGLTELFPRLRRLPIARRAAYGYLLGVVAVSGSLYTLSHCGGVPLRPPAIWTVAAVLTAAGLAARLTRRARPALQRGAPGRELARRALGPRGGALDGGRDGVLGPPYGALGPAGGAPGSPAMATGGGEAGAAGPPRRAAAWPRDLGGPFGGICLLLAAVVCAAVFAEAVSDPVNDWDGRMTWGAQARYVRQAGTVDAEALRNPRWYVTHPQYPLLLPVAQVAVLEAFGADPDAPLVRAIYAAFLPALLLVIYDGARRGAGPRAAALAVLTLAVTPYLLLGTGGAATTYSDLALACFFGAALGLLLAPRPCTADGVAAGLLLAGAALVKNEGAALAVLALALGWRPGRPAESTGAGRRPAESAAGGGRPAEITAAGRRPAGVPPRMRRLLGAALPLVLALALLASWRAGIPNRQDDAYPELLQVGGRPLSAVVAGIGTRLAACAPIVWQDMTSMEHWAGFWWMAAAALVAGHRALRHPLNRRRLAAAAGPPAIACAAYAVHPLGPALAAVTWERFLLQGAVPLMIVVAGAFAAMGRRWRTGGMPGRRR